MTPVSKASIRVTVTGVKLLAMIMIFVGRIMTVTHCHDPGPNKLRVGMNRDPGRGCSDANMSGLTQAESRVSQRRLSESAGLRLAASETRSKTRVTATSHWHWHANSDSESAAREPPSRSGRNASRRGRGAGAPILRLGRPVAPCRDRHGGRDRGGDSGLQPQARKRNSVQVASDRSPPARRRDSDVPPGFRRPQNVTPGPRPGRQSR